jgi:formate dehydrogenase maturation protein FdhE
MSLLIEFGRAIGMLERRFKALRMTCTGDYRVLSETEKLQLVDDIRQLKCTLAEAQRGIERAKRRLEYRAGYSIRDATALAMRHYYVVASAMLSQVALELGRDADRQIDVRFRPDATHDCGVCDEPIYSTCGACSATAGQRHAVCALCLANRFRGSEIECVPCALRLPAAETPRNNI